MNRHARPGRQTRMDMKEIDKEMRSMWGSLNGLSSPLSRSALAESVASLEPELLQWACPLDISVEATLMPLDELISVPCSIGQAASPLLCPSEAPGLSAAVFDWDAGDSTEGSQLGYLQQSLEKCSTDSHLSESPGLGDRHGGCTEDPTALELSLMPLTGPSLAVSLQGSFRYEPWEAAALHLSVSAPSSSLRTVESLSPACSMDSPPCKAALKPCGSNAAAEQRMPAERAASTDSNKSCAFSGFWPETPSPAAPLPPLQRIILPASPFAAAPALDAGKALSAALAAPPSVPQPRRAAAGLDRGIVSAGPAPAVVPPPAARQLPAPSLQLPAPAVRPAMCCVRAQPPPSRSVTFTQKNRRQQKEYNQRNRVRTAAVHASVDGLKDKRAALEREVGELLTRHKHLTMQQPWAQQHDEVTFVASLASLMPTMPGQLPSEQAAPNMDMLSKLMLEPMAVMDVMCKSSGPGAQLSALQVQALSTELPPLQPANPDTGLAGSTSIAWSSIMACLRLTKLQRDELAMLYETHLQDQAASQQDCLTVALKLQGLPGVVGRLTDCMWPKMATHLLSSQLTGIADREAEMIQDLNSACQKVLDQAQLRNLQLLAPAAAVDLRALCREVSATSRPPRRAPASRAAERAQPPAASRPGTPPQVGCPASWAAAHTMVSAEVKAPSVEGGPGLEAALGIVDVALPAAEGANLPVMPAPGPTVPQPFSEAGPTDTTDGATLPTACAKPVVAATQAAAEAAPLTKGRKRSAEATKMDRMIPPVTEPVDNVCCEPVHREVFGDTLLAATCGDEHAAEKIDDEEEAALQFPVHEGRRMKPKKMLSLGDLHTSSD